MSNKITITLNGEALTIAPQTTVADLLQQHAQLSGRFIVAINDELVVKSNYQQTIIQADDAVDTIAPITGG